MTHVLIIDSNPEAFNGPARAAGRMSTGENYAAALRACRGDVVCTVVAPYDGEEIPPLDRFDGVVFTGSSVEWNTDDDRAEPLRAVMRQVFDKGVPTLGSCNGMQLAASVLGGASQVSPNGREDGLAIDIRLTEAGRTHPLLRGRSDGYAVPCIHRDEVTRLPEGAVLLAGNAHTYVQAMAIETGGIRFWGMQYHPELDPADLGPVLARLGLMAQEDADDFETIEQDPEVARKFGARPDDMTPDARMTELSNWLASL